MLKSCINVGFFRFLEYVYWRFVAVDTWFISYIEKQVWTDVGYHRVMGLTAEMEAEMSLRRLFKL